MDLQNDLNAAQLEAVTYLDGPSLVIAGAGSGKTRVLTYKVAYLIEQGYKPWTILALTFTNKAAREMNQRIEQLVGPGSTTHLFSGTFHSIFARMLRREAELLGYQPNYTIYDASSSQSLVKNIIKELQLDDKKYKPSKIAARISEAKNRLLVPAQYADDSYYYNRDKQDDTELTGKIYEIYQERLLRANAMDFDDLLLNTFLLLRDHEERRNYYAQFFQFILVDEYQDTNYAQHQIITLLAEQHHRVCVVGDDAQSIYSFRGANIDNILSFQKLYPEAKLIKLEENYRSTQTIVNAANSIIRHNARQIPKKVFSRLPEGEKLQLIALSSDKAEAKTIGSVISRLHLREHIDYGDIAVLYRTNAQSRVLEEAFGDLAIPYRIYGSLSFYSRKEIRDLIAYFRLAVNGSDDEAFLRIVNYPARGIGNTTIGHLIAAANAHAKSLLEVAQSPLEYQCPVSRQAATRLQTFALMMDGFSKNTENTDIFDLACRILHESGMEADLQSEAGTPEGQARIENVQELLNSVKSFSDSNANGTMDQYISTISLLTDADRADDGSPRVTLTTIHAAKGLEFHTVFVAGLEDELFPSPNSRFEPRQMEEERRLFYVAVTRAKRMCYLTYAQSRYRYGHMEFSNPSPFIHDIDPQYIATTRSAETPKTLTTILNRPQSVTTAPKFNFGETRRLIPVPKPSTDSAPQTRRQAKTAQGTLSVGDRIRHDRFGSGTVELISNENDNTTITVKFDEVGTKKLLLKFAKFTILK